MFYIEIWKNIYIFLKYIKNKFRNIKIKQIKY